MKTLLFSIPEGTCPETYKNPVNSIGILHPPGARNAISLTFLENSSILGIFHENHQNGWIIIDIAILAPADL